MPGTSNELTLVARCVRGLEWLAADEIEARVPNAVGLALSPREISFRVPASDPDALGLRTIDDVFLLVGDAPDAGSDRAAPARIAGALTSLDWTGPLAVLRGFRPVPTQPDFDVVASVEGRHNYNRFTVQDTAGAMLEHLLPGQYLRRTADTGPVGEPSVTVRIFVRPGRVAITLRLADRPLHRRAYKQDTGPGTLHPPMAAALARLAGRIGTATVLDPFCGDGTIAIEAALCHPSARVRASDIDPTRVANAQRNADRAGVSLRLSREDAGTPGPGADVLITNPPWQIAVDARGSLRGSLDGFWRRLPTLLGDQGRLCLLADAGLDAPGTLRQLACRPTVTGTVRLAGRVSHLVLVAPSTPPRGALAWRRRAIAAGVLTSDGF